MPAMLFCIEDIAIYENHLDSWIAQYLDNHGFSNTHPDDTWHREGPWIWVNVETMSYQYCPHYGVSSGKPLFDIFITGKDFCTIWEIIERRRKLHAETGIKWTNRINKQKENRA